MKSHMGRAGESAAKRRQGTRTILPGGPEAITASCAAGASASGNSRAITGASAPFSSPRADRFVRLRELRRRRVPEHHAADIGLARHGVARIDFDRPAAADDDHAPMHREQLEIVREVHIREHFQDQIDPAAGAIEHRLPIRGIVVIEHLVGALAP